MLLPSRERTETTSVPGATTSGLTRPSAHGPRDENAASPRGFPAGGVEILSEATGSAG